MKDKSAVIEWDGQNLPAELHELPPGRYVVQPIDDPTLLSLNEENGIIAALDELDAEGGLALSGVLREIRRTAPRG